MIVLNDQARQRRDARQTRFCKRPLDQGKHPDQSGPEPVTKT